MNLYKRINNYLLEHYPILWNTNFIWMVLVALLLNGFMFLVGYMITNISVLSDFYIEDYFFRSGMPFIYYIMVIIIVVIWLLRFYKHNPFKYFYPVKKTYFYALFIQVFVVFFLLLLGNYSFTLGAFKKTNKVLNETTLEQDRKTVNLAYPFLVRAYDEYQIKQRCYPAPFPLSLVHLVNKKAYPSNHTKLPAEMAVDETAAAVATDADRAIEDDALRYKIDYSKPHLILNGAVYQFGTYKEVKIDSCTTNNQIDSIYDVSNVYGIHQYSIYNFSNVFISKNNSSDEYRNDIAPTVHRWLINKNEDSIQKVLIAFSKILNKYDIKHKYDPAVLANLAINLNLDELKAGLIGESYGNYYRDDVVEYPADAAASDSQDLFSDSQTYKLVQQCKQYRIDYYALTKVYRNQDTVVSNKMDDAYFWIILYSCFSLAMLVLAGKFTNLANILIAAVIAGALLLLYFFIVISILKYDSNDFDNAISAFIYTTLIAIVCFIIGNSQLFNKWIRDKALLLLYISMPIIFFLINMIIHYSTKYTKVFCGSRSTYYSYELTPTNCFVAILLSLIPVYYLVRKWKAKPE